MNPGQMVPFDVMLSRVWARPCYNLVDMTHASLTRSIKQAMTETLRDNRDAVRDLLAEVLEDLALVNAIRTGEKTRRVKRETVMRTLARKK
jgi:hypothetical protein